MFTLLACAVTEPRHAPCALRCDSVAQALAAQRQQQAARRGQVGPRAGSHCRGRGRGGRAHKLGGHEAVPLEEVLAGGLGAVVPKACRAAEVVGVTEVWLGRRGQDRLLKRALRKGAAGVVAVRVEAAAAVLHVVPAPTACCCVMARGNACGSLAAAGSMDAPGAWCTCMGRTLGECRQRNGPLRWSRRCRATMHAARARRGHVVPPSTGVLWVGTGAARPAQQSTAQRAPCARVSCRVQRRASAGLAREWRRLADATGTACSGAAPPAAVGAGGAEQPITPNPCAACRWQDARRSTCGAVRAGPYAPEAGHSLGRRVFRRWHAARRHGTKASRRGASFVWDRTSWCPGGGPGSSQ